MSTEDGTLDPTVLAGLRAALGDDQLVADLIQVFLSQTPGDLATLASAMRNGDQQEIAATAHLIKGSALTFGATRLAQLCARLEASPVGSDNLADSVAQEVHDVAASLSTYASELNGGR